MCTRKLVSLFLSLVMALSLSGTVLAQEEPVTVTDISAVKSAAVLNLTGNELSHPSQKLADGAQRLYTFVTGK